MQITGRNVGEKNPMYGKKHSDSARKKMSEARKKRETKPETLIKMSIVSTGKNNPFYGKHHTPQTRAILSQKNIGRLHTENWKQMMSKRNTGITNPMYGKHLSNECRAHLAEIRKGKNTLDKNPSWRGGVSFEPYCPKFNHDLRKRIRAFFDNRCVMCGNPNENGRALSCHHITYDKNMCCNEAPVQFAALCGRHHGMTNGGNRLTWENMLHRAIEEIWDGKSYFTKEEYAEMVE
jgi:hypothetical protein